MDESLTPPGAAAAPFAFEDAALDAARARSSAADDVPSAATGSLLAWIARGIPARSAVEVGSAAGITGLWLLQGLAPKGVLTSIEPDAHRHGLATQAYTEGGLADRVRAIEGDPVEVLPRLADGAYDVVLLQDSVDPGHLDHALRLVRAGGVVVLRSTGEPAARSVVRGLVGDDEPTITERVAAEERLDAVGLPLDGGVIVARRLPDGD